GKVRVGFFQLQAFLAGLCKAIPHKLSGLELASQLLERPGSLRLLAPGIRFRLDRSPLRELQVVLLAAELPAEILALLLGQLALAERALGAGGLQQAEAFFRLLQLFRAPPSFGKRFRAPARQLRQPWLKHRLLFME